MATALSTIETAAKAPPTTLNVAQLSFTSRGQEDTGIDLWSPRPVDGGWADQCRAGRALGHEAIEYIQQTGDAAMLPGVVRAIVERGTFGGVEVGFFTAVSVALVEAA